MAKAKVGIIVGISVVLVVGIVLAINAENPLLEVQDEVDAEDKTVVSTSPQPDSVTITDTATLNKSGDFYIDEEGKKVYVIKAEDSPDIGD